MRQLFFSDLKMLLRNRQALFWSLAFPIMFTIIFGLFFGKGSAQAGTITVINQSKSALAKNFVLSFKKTEIFKFKSAPDVKRGREMLKKNEIAAVVVIPEKFGESKPDAPKKIKVIYDPANIQSNAAILGFVDKFLTNLNFQSQNIKPTFSIEEEKTNSRKLNYFDFILVGLIGMALMNSSIQGVSINISRYREDKILKRLTTTPLKPWKFILAEVFSRLFINLIQISLILLIGVWWFEAHIYGNLFLIYLFSLLGAILFQSIGFTVASISKTTAAAEGMATAIAIPMMFLAGVFFPIDLLPSWLSGIVSFLPLAPLLKIIRGIALDQTSPFLEPINFVIILGWILITLVFSSYKFRMVEE